MEYLQEVYLDLNPDSSYLVITAKQYDHNTRGIIAHLTKDGQPYSILQNGNETHLVTFRVKKPDGHTVIDNATINQDGTIKAVFSSQCLGVHGRAYADLVETDAQGNILSTASFIIDIKPSPETRTTDIESMDDYPIIYNFITNAQNVIDSVQEWANGYHGNTPVDSSSPAYKNNSKYWADRAKNVVDTLTFQLNPSTGILSISYEEP